MILFALKLTVLNFEFDRSQAKKAYRFATPSRLGQVRLHSLCAQSFFRDSFAEKSEGVSASH